MMEQLEFPFIDPGFSKLAHTLPSTFQEWMAEYGFYPTVSPFFNETAARNAEKIRVGVLCYTYERAMRLFREVPIDYDTMDVIKTLHRGHVSFVCRDSLEWNRIIWDVRFMSTEREKLAGMRFDCIFTELPPEEQGDILLYLY